MTGGDSVHFSYFVDLLQVRYLKERPLRSFCINKTAGRQTRIFIFQESKKDVVPRKGRKRHRWLCWFLAGERWERVLEGLHFEEKRMREGGLEKNHGEPPRPCMGQGSWKKVSTRVGFSKLLYFWYACCV